jgi:hypothetical protein
LSSRAAVAATADAAATVAESAAGAQEVEELLAATAAAAAAAPPAASDASAPAKSGLKLGTIPSSFCTFHTLTRAQRSSVESASSLSCVGQACACVGGSCCQQQQQQQQHSRWTCAGICADIDNTQYHPRHS